MRQSEKKSIKYTPKHHPPNVVRDGRVYGGGVCIGHIINLRHDITRALRAASRTPRIRSELQSYNPIHIVNYINISSLFFN